MGSSGIVISGTRTGFLVCIWFVPVHTGMYLYVLVNTKLESTYWYVLSMYQNKVMQCCTSTYSHRSHSHFISNQAPSCLLPSLVSFLHDALISRVLMDIWHPCVCITQYSTKSCKAGLREVQPGMYMYILSTYKFTHVFTWYKQVHLGTYRYIPVCTLNILVHTKWRLGHMPLAMCPWL